MISSCLFENFIVTFGVQFKKVWVNQDQGMIFCLMEEITKGDVIIEPDNWVKAVFDVGAKNFSPLLLTGQLPVAETMIKAPQLKRMRLPSGITVMPGKVLRSASK